MGLHLVPTVSYQLVLGCLLQNLRGHLFIINTNMYTSIDVGNIDHQQRKGSMAALTSVTAVPESGYSSKLETSPRLLTLGMQAGLIFFLSRSSQLKELNQRCFLISSTPFLRLPQRLLRSATNKCFTSDFASLSKLPGKEIFPRRIFLYIPIGSSSLKGSMPACISYSSTPNVHQSTAFPCPWFRITSGAMYTGVPQIVKVRPSFKNFAKPKSVSFRQPSLPIRRFSGLRSRKIMFLECRYSKQEVTVAPKKRACSVGNASTVRRQVKSSPPLMSSRTRQRKRESCARPSKETMKGWLMWECTQFSLQTWSICCDFMICTLLRSLSATNLPVFLSLATFTLPNPPLPKIRPTSQSSSRIFFICPSFCIVEIIFYLANCIQIEIEITLPFSRISNTFLSLPLPIFTFFSALIPSLLQTHPYHYSTDRRYKNGKIRSFYTKNSMQQSLCIESEKLKQRIRLTIDNERKLIEQKKHNL